MRLPGNFVPQIQKIAVPALGDATEGDAIAGRDLSRHKRKPVAKVAAATEERTGHVPRRVRKLYCLLYCLAGFEQSVNVTPYKPDTDKRARLVAQTDLFAGGSVRFPQRAGWLEEFVAELLAFPGRHDDQVDALAQGLAWGRQRWAHKMTIGAIRGLY